MVSRSKPAFTIVELLVVIVVIGILAAITVVSYTGISQKAIVSSLQTDLTNASKLLKMDQVINSAYPATLAAANGGKGIPSSSDTTYQYVFNNSITPPGFCITATKSFTTYKVTENTAPEIGDCTDYGLVLYLDAGNTASYPSPFTGTTWYDLSGMGNNASLVNGVTYSGINGGSLLFDGVDDYGYVSSNFFQKTQNEFTIEIVSNSLFQLVTRGGSGGWWTTTNQFTLGVIADYPLSYAFNSNTPYIINYIINKSNLSRYINGVLTDNINISQNRSSSMLNLMYFNVFLNSNSSIRAGTYLNSAIYSIKIFDRAINDFEVTNNFNNLKARYGL